MTQQLRDKLAFVADEEVLEVAKKLLKPEALEAIGNISLALSFLPINLDRHTGNVVDMRQLQLKRAIEGRAFDVKPTARREIIPRPDADIGDIAITIDVMLSRQALTGIVELDAEEEGRIFPSRLRIPSSLLSPPIKSRKAFEDVTALYSDPDSTRQVVAKYYSGASDVVY